MRSSEMKLCMGRLRPYFYSATLFTMLITVISLAPIGYMQDVYGPVLNSRSYTTLAMVTLLLVIALIISGLISWVREKILIAAAIRLTQELSRRTIDASFSANLMNAPGAKLAITDLRIVRNFIMSSTMVALLEAPMGIIFLFLVFMIHPIMGIFSLGGVVVVLLIALITERQVRPHSKLSQQNYNAAQNYINETSRNALVIEALGMKNAIRVRWQSIQQDYLKHQAKASEAQSRSAAATKFVVYTKMSLILGVGVLLTLTGILPPQASAYLIIGKILGAKAVQPMMTLIQTWKSVVTARDSFNRLDDFLEKIPPAAKRMSLPAPIGFLSVEALGARAPGTKTTVVSGLRFSVQPGTVLGVIGPSGAGKSSLARLLLGIWPAAVGTVRLDGVDISGWPKSELGPYLGYLPQDVELFDGTIAENIARFGAMNQSALDLAIKLAGLTEILGALPNGPNTHIGEEGISLSGGQQQRIGLARAIYGNPKLIVLDEPNSSLDERGDADLNNLIMTMKTYGATVVIITHRKSVYPVLDYLLAMHKGKMQLFGARDEVLNKLEATKAVHTTATTQLPSENTRPDEWGGK